MGRLVGAFLYMAVAGFANPVVAGDLAVAESLREGDMRKLMFHGAPDPVPSDVIWTDTGGATGGLDDYRGRWVLLNFWATWCAPCRVEMPMLSALQDRLGGDGFAVVTLAAGRNAPAGIDRFLDDIGVTNLPTWMDPRDGLASRIGVMGLPVTILIDPEGHEVARMIGEADWNSDNAVAVLTAAMGQ